MKRISWIIATFLGIGYFPLAPGSVASFFVALSYRYFLHRIPWHLYLGVFLVIMIVGVISSNIFSNELKSKDPRKIVIDEVAGQYLIFFRLSPSWINILGGFLLFRFFDILKPFPIRKIENFPKGWGIMLDDTMAAIYAGIILNLYLLF